MNETKRKREEGSTLSDLSVFAKGGKVDLYLNGVRIDDKCLSCVIRMDGLTPPTATVTLICDEMDLEIKDDVQIKKITLSKGQS